KVRASVLLFLNVLRREEPALALHLFPSRPLLHLYFIDEAFYHFVHVLVGIEHGSRYFKFFVVLMFFEQDDHMGNGGVIGTHAFRSLGFYSDIEGRDLEQFGDALAQTG